MQRKRTRAASRGSGHSIPLPARALARILALVVVALAAPAGARAAGQVPPPEAEAPPPLPDRLLLRAGRVTPPGLTSARVAERERDAAQARAELARALTEEDPRREAWLARLRAILADATGAWFGEELWLAVAGISGELRIVELEPPLVAALEPHVSERRRAVAQVALHDLHGLWFDSPGEVAAFREEVRAAGAPERLLQRQRELEEENRNHLKRLFRYEPKVAIDALSHRDPRIRVEAARVLGEVGAAMQDGRADVVEALFARVDREAWPAALHAVFSSLDRLLAADWQDGARVAEWRSRYLAALEREVEAPVPGLELSLARALAGLPWGPDGGGRPHPAKGLDLAGRLMRRLVARGPAADPDVLVGVIDSLSTLAALVRNPSGEPGGDVLAVRLPVFELLQDPAWDLAVRTSAARAAATLAVPRDAALLVDVLEQPGTSTELEFVLLNTLRGLAPRVDPGGETAARIAAGVYARVDDPDADVRRRALAFLADPAVRPLLEGHDPGVLVERLGEEPIDELRATLLQLLRELGTERELDALLALEDLGALADAGPGLAADLARTLGHLARGDSASTLRAATRLAQGSREADFGRTLLALQLVAELDEDAAAELTPREHARIVDWAVAVRAAGVRLRNALPPVFVERLVREHLPAAAAEGAPGGAARFHHRSALFLADLGEETPARDAEIEKHFASALSAREPDGDDAFRARVRRDRARFWAGRGKDAPALEEYRHVMAWEGARAEDAEGAGGTDGAGGSVGAAAVPRPTLLLELGDLRAAARLAASAAASTGNPAAAREAARESFRFGEALVHQPSWPSEPGEVRLRDLRNLVERAESRHDAELLARLARWLAPPRAEEEREGAGGSRIAGLEAEWGAELAGLRARLAAALRAGGAEPVESASDPDLPAPEDGSGAPGEPAPGRASARTAGAG